MPAPGDRGMEGWEMESKMSPRTREAMKQLQGKGPRRMPSYTVETDAKGLDAKLFEVVVTVCRRDGADLDATDLAACERVFPSRALLASRKAARAKKPARAKRTTATPKRKAAKRS